MFLKEIRYRWVNFLLTLSGVVAAVTILVLFFMMTAASKNETRVLTRDMGFNLKILPKETDMNTFWVNGYSERYMPEDYAQRIVDARAFSYAHLTATLHKQISWHDLDVVLTGISPNELEPKQRKKSKMIFAVTPGKVYVGYEIAHQLHLEAGSRVEVLGKTFEIEQCLAETGSNDDIRLFFDLSELQSLLHLEHKINEIMALNCMCSTVGDDPLGVIRNDLEQILPDAKVIMNRTIATARERQRKMVDNYMAVLLPVFLVVCALWIATFSMLNVMQRKTEIGLLRAMGFNTRYIVRLFLSRVLLIGLIGAVIGYFLATWMGMTYGPEVFKVTARSVHPMYELLYWSLLLAPLFALIASLIPITLAISQEPAKVLKDI